MGQVEKVSVALTRDMAAMVRQAVDSGEYVSSSEVIRDALRDWKREREERASVIEHLRALWRDGIASGPPVEGNFDAADIARRGRARRAG